MDFIALDEEDMCFFSASTSFEFGSRLEVSLLEGQGWFARRGIGLPRLCKSPEIDNLITDYM